MAKEKKNSRGKKGNTPRAKNKRGMNLQTTKRKKKGTICDHVTRVGQ